MHSRSNNMVWRFFVKLLDVFSKVCFNAFYSMLMKKIIEFNFFSHHTLALHDRLAILFNANLPDLIQCLLCVLCPYHLSSSLHDVRLKCLELQVKIFYGFPLKVLCPLSCEFNILEL